MEGICEHGKKTFGFHKESRIFFEKMSDNQLFKEYPAPRSK